MFFMFVIGVGIGIVAALIVFVAIMMNEEA